MSKLALLASFLICASCFGMEKYKDHVECIPKSSFAILYWSMQHKWMDKFEKELKKKEAKEEDLIMLLSSAVLTKNRTAFKLLIKYGARLSEVDLKTLSRIPESFLD